MAKDPAFLFYYQDFIHGTAFMTLEELGAYIKILCFLADRDTLSEKDILRLISKPIWESIWGKFGKENGEYFHHRLRQEVQKRRNFTDSRRKNLQVDTHMGSHMDSHMENGNGNRDRDKDRVRKGVKEEYIAFEKSTLESWNEFADKFPALATVRSITPGRRKHLKARFENKDFVSNWDVVIQKIPDSDFLLGKVEGKEGRKWKVDFDFLIRNDENYQKILEGKYQDPGKSKKLKEVEEMLDRR